MPPFILLLFGLHFDLLFSKVYQPYDDRAEYDVYKKLKYKVEADKRGYHISACGFYAYACRPALYRGHKEAKAA